MRARGAAIQGGLAALGLVAAYATWQREPERTPGEVVVVDAGKNDITKIRFDDDAKWVELSPTKESGERVVWLKISANEQQKTPEREVRGNDGAVKLLEKFTPLYATRALGTLPDDKLKEFGISESKKKMTISFRGQTRTFKVGKSPFGVSDPYVMDEGDKRVYVLGAGVISDLEAAAVRLVDRTLHVFKLPEADGITVKAGAKSRELVVSGAETPLSTKIAPKKTPDKPDEMAKNWHDKLWRLFVVEVLGKGEAPKGGEPQIALRVDYTMKGKPVGFIELGRVTPPPPEPTASTPTPPAPAAEVYARTEHTSGWVKMPASAEDLLKEADKIATE